MKKVRRLTKIENGESPSSRDPFFSPEPFLTRIPYSERERERERERRMVTVLQ